MAIRQIFKNDAECLYKKCRPVERFDKKLSDLIDDMADTMYEADGVGLAAPQVGILRRVFVIDCGDGLVEMVNPEIIETSGEPGGHGGLPVIPRQAGLRRASQPRKGAGHTTATAICMSMRARSFLPAPYSMKMTTLTGLYIPVSLPIRRRATRKRSLSIQSQRTIRRKKNRCA